MNSQSSFYYFNAPGQFSTYPYVVQENLPPQQYQQSQSYDLTHNQPNSMHHRPSPSGLELLWPSRSLSSQSTITPVASPRPMHQKHNSLCQLEGQQLSVNTACNPPDLYVSPSTPPMSVTGSTASSPPSTCGVTQTPVSCAFFPLGNIEGVKEGCEGEVKSEILAGGDWTRTCSPPLTPGMYTYLQIRFFVGRIRNAFPEYTPIRITQSGLVAVLNEVHALTLSRLQYLCTLVLANPPTSLLSILVRPCLHLLHHIIVPPSPAPRTFVIRAIC